MSVQKNNRQQVKGDKLGLGGGGVCGSVPGGVMNCSVVVVFVAEIVSQWQPGGRSAAVL